MLSKLNFKKSTLTLSVNSFIQWDNQHKRFCLSLFLMLLAQQGFAQVAQPDPTVTQTEFEQQLKSEAVKQGMDSPEELEKIENFQEKQAEPDSLQMLQQQEQAGQTLAEFKPIEFEDLEELPIEPVSQAMADEIFREAENAKNQAQLYRAGQVTEVVVSDATQQELVEINQAPVNVDQLMSSIQNDSKIVVEANEAARTLPEIRPADEIEEPNFFKRWLYKIRPSRQINTVKVPRISADVVFASAQNSSEVSSKAYAQALENLETNIKGKLSSFTQESFSDFPSALPQLRTMSNQAAQAVGFYNAEFKFEKLSENRVRVRVTPNAPVQIREQNIELSGAGQQQAQFQVISVLPDQDVGDIFNHGLYEQTKTRINDAATNNGYFDSYWRLHDVKVAQPQNTADVNLRFETGDRYKLGPVEFRMSDPSKPLPMDLDVLQSMVSWEDGADYAFWRVNGLANNLTNSRYFN